MSGCQRCLECGCLAVSDVLCADVWLSAMSCVRMSGCQRCLVCGCLAVIDVLCATGDCVLKQRSQPAAVSIPLFNFVAIAYILLTRFTEAVLPRKSDHGDDDVFETTGPSRKMRRHNALLSV